MSFTAETEGGQKSEMGSQSTRPPSVSHRATTFRSTYFSRGKVTKWAVFGCLHGFLVRGRRAMQWCDDIAWLAIRSPNRQIVSWAQDYLLRYHTKLTVRPCYSSRPSVSSSARNLESFRGCHCLLDVGPLFVDLVVNDRRVGCGRYEGDGLCMSSRRSLPGVELEIPT